MDFIYDRARQAFLEGNIAWLSANIKAVLVDTGAYTPNQATHEFLSDIPVGARIATSGNLTGKTSTNGVADADDVVLSDVSPAGVSVEATVLYVDTGAAGTSRLICFLDSVVTTNGNDITVAFDNGATRIFKL